MTFATRALGEVGSSAADESLSRMELQIPLQIEGAVIRLQCACGFTVEMGNDALESLGITVPADGLSGRYLAVESCSFCGEGLKGLALRDIPKE